MSWVVLKMRELGLLHHPAFKLMALVDRNAMITGGGAQALTIPSLPYHYPFTTLSLSPSLPYHYSAHYPITIPLATLSLSCDHPIHFGAKLQT